MEPFELLGIRIMPVGMEESLHMVTHNIQKNQGGFFCFANIHLIMEGYRDPVLRRVLNDSVGNFVDGMGTALGLRVLGNKFSGRVRGAEFMLNLCSHAAQNKFGIFLYGNTNETLKELHNRLKTLFPGIQIVGQISPPFRELTIEEEDDVVRRINNADPRILLVSLGAPKQEKWMWKNQGRIRAIQFGVGAAFDFITGKVKQAPVWMQRGGLEWLYRLPQQPRKTIYRMSLAPSFAWEVLLQKVREY
jgi:N-acetylglucosaminyldiphosphoundecaprenol N-acetyl-beta-D-mannosaminyltransferase